MNPSVLLDLDAPKPRRRWVMRALVGGIRMLWTALLFDPLTPFKRKKVYDREGFSLRGFFRGLLFRVAGVPVLMLAVAVVNVFNGTHPAISAAMADPRSLGVYHDPVSFMGEDGTRLEGWFVPILDARRVLDQKELALRQSYPAVILVHDFGLTREQMLPMVKPLHDAGFIVFVPSLRGNDSVMPSGQTFGLLESQDLGVAIELLKRRPTVDPKRIAILGQGTGATAALLAADRDPDIAAVVLDHPVIDSATVITRISPDQWWLQWMRPLCKWTFDFAYSADINDVNLNLRKSTLESRSCLVLNDAASSIAPGMKRYAVDQIVDFLKHRLKAKPSPASVDASRVEELAPASG